ncbi:histone-lysine N-methyltransferase SETMAR [Trichonephila clavata]|uniref:Histone-lysine N-methyltransferase SETMAR n=1 Tax=Trichonephila clavata TaxID=2740835 RepID=A0A8X6M0V4_TRICU|nr:histone-lysine N-methyltransferase SETMAR [Trichonephila clavata]
MDKWVPRELNENKKKLFETSSTILLLNQNDPFLNRIVTCDEKWILYNNQRLSAQWLDQRRLWILFDAPQPVCSTTTF